MTVIDRASAQAAPAPPPAAAPPALAPARPLSAKHILSLDGLRGIAILMVLGHHLFLHESKLPWPHHLDIPIKILANGWVGVDLFFVLSGFLITGILLDAKGEQRYFRNFYARRTLRIFPLYYFVLFLVLVLYPPIARALGFTPDLLKDNPLWFWFYGTNILLTVRHTWFTQTPLSLSHYWSLSVEEHFYLVWPLVVYLIARRRTLAYVCAGVIGSVWVARAVYIFTTHDGIGAYVLTPFRMDDLLIGALAALVFRSSYWSAVARRFAPPLAAIGIVAFLFAAAQPLWNREDGYLTPIVGYPAMSLLFVMMLLAPVTLGPTSRPARFLSHPVLRFFGRYSYGLYVYHGFVLQATDSPAAFTYFRAHIHSYTAAMLACKCIGAALATVIAVASYHLIEARFLKLKKFFHSLGVPPLSSKRALTV